MGFVTSDGLGVRLAVDEDLPFLRRMLYEAANRPGSPWPAFDVSMEEARNKRFWTGWMREGDIGVVAEDGTTPVGAAWIRRFTGEELSPIDDDDVPVLAIGVELDYRGRGVGGRLMDALIEQARATGVRAISLTTGLFNHAALRLYRRRGFVEVLRRGEGVKMVLVLD
jgi:ribosomal protein S18 acetylase RimI-like enzyme